MLMTIDALINFKIICALTFSTITMTRPRKWKYINLSISGRKQDMRIEKKAYFILLKGHLTDY